MEAEVLLFAGNERVAEGSNSSATALTVVEPPHFAEHLVAVQVGIFGEFCYGHSSSVRR